MAVVYEDRDGHRWSFPSEFVEQLGGDPAKGLAELGYKKVELPLRVKSPYLTANEAAAYLRKSVKAFYSWCERHNVKGAKGSRRLLFTREQLDAALIGANQPRRSSRR